MIAVRSDVGLSLRACSELHLPPAIFLDRDDTLMEANSLPPPPPPAAIGDVVDPALVRLLPGARDACARLKAAGFTLVVFSNQGVVARGGATIATVHSINRRLNELLDGAIDSFYFCPFHPKGTVADFTREHPWRKPGPGMILAAASELGLNVGASWVVGDAQRDIDAALAAGISRERCILLGSDAPNLIAAADRVMTFREPSSGVRR